MKSSPVGLIISFLDDCIVVVDASIYDLNVSRGG